MRIEIREIRNHNDKTTKILDDPTNGDMVKAMFPNAIGCDVPITLTNSNKIIRTCINGVTDFTLDWWNTPYKKELQKQ